MLARRKRLIESTNLWVRVCPALMLVDVGAIVRCAGFAAAVAERDRNVSRAPVGVVDHAARAGRCFWRTGCRW